MEDVIKQFAKTSYIDGDGYGDGYGYGDDDGSGSGSSDGYRFGDGSGYIDGDGYGDGYIDGDGSGSGYRFGDGSGYIDGYGYGDGDGDGYGDGYGHDDGSGSGSGDGSGYGSGDSDGLKSISKSNVWMIDKLQTIITSVHGNIATGFILQSDLTMSPCVIVKQDNMFAHGKDAHEAFESLQQKFFSKYPVEKRIEEFKKSHPDYNKKYSAKDLFDWHNKLTGSCLMGRNSFCRDKNIDLEKDEFSVYEFIAITKKSYGYETIKMLSAKNG